MWVKTTPEQLTTFKSTLGNGLLGQRFKLFLTPWIDPCRMSHSVPSLPFLIYCSFFFAVVYSTPGDQECYGAAGAQCSKQAVVSGPAVTAIEDGGGGVKWPKWICYYWEVFREFVGILYVPI